MMRLNFYMIFHIFLLTKIQVLNNLYPFGFAISYPVLGWSNTQTKKKKTRFWR